VNGSCGSAVWSLLALDFVVSAGLAENATLCNDDYVLATELLLQLTHKTCLNAVEGLELGVGDENHDCLLASSYINLVCSRDGKILESHFIDHEEDMSGLTPTPTRRQTRTSTPNPPPPYLASLGSLRTLPAHTRDEHNGNTIIRPTLTSASLDGESHSPYASASPSYSSLMTLPHLHLH